MTESLPRRKRIRLNQEVYDGPGAFSVTVSTSNRSPVFRQPEAVNLCTSALAEVATRHRMDVLAYCFMPDHLHLLIEAHDDGNLIRFMKDFKQASAFRYRQAFKEPLWQKGYHDHVLRREEDLYQVATYILYNPARAGLADSTDGYPFSGGILAGDLKVAPTSIVQAASAATERDGKP